MNKTFTLAIGAFLALSAYSTVSLAASPGESGYYGRIDVKDGPRPKLIYAKPVMMQGKKVNQEPVYLHVRPGHARNWKNHCKEYEACGKRVYFVNHKWYETAYVDHHRQRNSKDRKDGRRDDGRRDHSSEDHHGKNDHQGKDDHNDRDDRHGKNDHHGRDNRGEAYGNNGRGNDNGRGQGNGKFDD